jgi:hypothetical protein
VIAGGSKKARLKEGKIEETGRWQVEAVQLMDPQG